MVTEKQFKLLRFMLIHKEKTFTQRQLAEELDLSLGTINTLLKKMKEEKWLDEELHLTELGQKVLEPYRVENAIIMAAGMSSRFAPLSYEIPKGLLQAAFSNMGERFGYYIMNAVLALFLCSKFGLSDETSGLIASLFLAAIYVMSLVGGVIADRTQNYQRTIESGLVVMALGYVALSIPVLATPENNSYLLAFTIFALVLIAVGNGLFKGNLQAIVGQMYDDFETEAAKVSPERLKWAQGQRDAGFQIFYVFINLGALAAPFIAPVLRSWWLGRNGLTYDAALPQLCHKYINGVLDKIAPALGRK